MFLRSKDEVELRVDFVVGTCLVFLCLCAVQLYFGFRSLPDSWANPGAFVDLAISLLSGLACILAARGLWKRRPWGWWVGALIGTCGLALNAFGFLALLGSRYLLPQKFKPPPVSWNMVQGFVLWTLAFALLLGLLFQKRVLAAVAQEPFHRLRRGLIAVCAGLALPILVVGIMAIAAFVGISRQLQQSPFDGPPVDPSTLFGREAGSVYAMAASPDGKYLAVEAAGNGERAGFKLGLLELGTEKLRWLSVPDHVSRMRWSPDGRILAADCGSHGNIHFISAETGKVAWSKAFPAIHTAFHPDGSLWYLDYGDNTLWSIDPQSRTCVHRLLNPCDPVQGFAISPDGRRIALAWGDFSRMVIQVVDSSNGTSLGKWSDVENSVITDMRFSGDGKWLLTAHAPKATEGVIKVWNSATGKMEYEIKDLYTLFFDFDHVPISPDGKFLAARALDGKREIWSMEDRTWIWTMPEGKLSTKMDPGIFSPDSKAFWAKAPFTFGRDNGLQGGLQRWTFLGEGKGRPPGDPRVKP
jgi:hypothetical protein